MKSRRRVNSAVGCYAMTRRQLTQVVVLVLMCAACCSFGLAQNCKPEGRPDWNASTFYVDPGCATKLRSPNGRLLLRFSSNGRMSINGIAIHLEEGLMVPTVMVSWSPKSDAFFINDGEGSGMSSKFRLFRMRGRKVFEDKAIQKAAVSLYRHRTQCRRSAFDPNVYGFGWDAHGRTLYLLVQATVHEPCGDSRKFISLVVRTSDAKVTAALSNAQTKTRFGSLLPPSLFTE